MKKYDVDRERLHGLVEGARWFENLGAYAQEGASDLPGITVVPISPAQWIALTGAALSAEFLLEPEEEPEDIPRPSVHLPSSYDADDPIRGKELRELEAAAGIGAEAKKARMAIQKIAFKSLRRMHKHPLLKVGPVDSTLAARGAAGFACRSASTEILVGSIGFWNAVLSLYARGHWPFALDGKGALLVL